MNPFDSSGRRGGKPGYRSEPKVSGAGFPYDKDKPEQPGLHRGITPKYTDHSVWDDVAEAAGIPFNLKMASRGNNGAGVPGANKGWAGMPSLPWDVNDVDLDEGEPLSIDQRVPDEEEIPDDMPMFYEPSDVTQQQPQQRQSVGAKPVDLSMTIMTVARELMSPSSVWGELFAKLERLNISSRKGR